MSLMFARLLAILQAMRDAFCPVGGEFPIVR